MNSGYFGDILRATMIYDQISPSLLAEKIDTTISTVARWLNGTTYPNKYLLAKIFLVTSKNHFEMAESLAKSRYWGSRKFTRRNPEPFFFRRRNFIRMLAGAATSKDLNQKQRSKLFNISEQILSHASDPNLNSKGVEDASSLSELIILPKEDLVFVNDWRRLIHKIRMDPSELFKLGWKKFEDLIGHLLEEYGWAITSMGYTKDDGIDLIAIRRIEPKVEFSMMIQCKRYSKHRKVGLSVVKDVWATKWENGFHHAMIATTSYFTKGAVRKAESWNFDLRDHDCVIELCKEYGRIVN